MKTIVATGNSPLFCVNDVIKISATIVIKGRFKVI